jgi:uncharacterized SAM-binding protein YcdF (DUF218 family)
MTPFAWARWALRLGALVLAAAVVYGGVTFVQVWVASRRDEPAPAQAILVFGAAQYDGNPSPVLRARLDHAVELWREGVAPTIVVTGGRRPGDRFTEAGAAARYLHGQGVPDSAILREVQGHSSWESLAGAAAFLDDRGIEDVILVSDPYHSLRIEAMAGELGLNATVSPADTGASLGQLVRETAAVSVGRIIGYRRLAGVERARDEAGSG